MSNPNLGENCCYASLISKFLEETEEDWIEKMRESFKKNLDLVLGSSQVEAWKDCFRVLTDELKEIAACYPEFSIVFEYILPYESGRRPDVLLLSKEHVIILEFKRKDEVLTSDLDQVSAYARDIREYHFESRDKTITPVLMLTRTTTLSEEKREDVYLSCKGRLCITIKEIVGSDQVNQCDLDAWLHSRYEPLPTIVEAARMIMKKEKLPDIRRYNSTCIPDAIGYLIEKTKDAIENRKHVVAFVTGVPGAGKTFLGLQFVYNIYDTSRKCNSVYLSGNGPLIKVLQYVLKNKTFVRDLHGVTTQYLVNGAPDFNNNIVVFDEGQRAWDSEQMAKKKNTTMSEPDLMIELCSKRLEWCVMLVLVGEGQEIYNGENSGIQQWDEAIKKSEKDWEIVCPEKLDSRFTNKIVEEKRRNNLDLSVSLRSHIAGEVSEFINLLIDGNIEKASKLAENNYSNEFDMYITRDLDKAKEYVINRYSGENEKRYGLLASSKSSILPRFGMDNSFGTTRNTDHGKWYGAPVTDPKSCCALKDVVTEFGCQGLEIDMPIIGWERDMKWVDGKWAKFRPYQPETSDENTFRKNSYRVLLTRGRDGFIIFVPPVEELNVTYDVLRKAGIKDLT